MWMGQPLHQLPTLLEPSLVQSFTLRKRNYPVHFLKGKYSTLKDCNIT